MSEQVLSADVVVIGGGPAGSCAASWIARAGHRVVLLEKERFPRPHIGESLLAMTMPYLRDLGLDERMLELFPKKRGAVFVWRDQEKPVELDMPSSGYAHQVHRPIFDAILLRNAERLGAKILRRTEATEFVQEEGRVAGVRTVDANGNRLTLRARFVIDASGLGRLIQRKLQLPKERMGPMHWAVFGHMRGARRMEGIRKHDIITESTANGWVWFIPLSAERTSVGFVGLRRDTITSDLWTTLDAEIAGTRLVRTLIDTGGRHGAASCVTYRNEIVSDPWGPGYLLVGDAAGFVDPLLSTGVHAGIHGAHLASACVDALLRGGRDEEVVSNFYRGRLRNHYRRLTALVDVIYASGHQDGAIRQARGLGDLSGERLDTLEQALGPLSMFALLGAADQLDFAPGLRERFRKYQPVQPRLATVERTSIVRLADHARVEPTLMVRGAKLQDGIVIHHPRDLVMPVEVSADSLAARTVALLARDNRVSDLVDQLAVAEQRPAAELDDKVRKLIGTYHQIGLISMADPAS
jgi:halogenation protein CepH